MSRADHLAKGQYWKRSWNPFTGCTPVGAGCDNCWARRMAYRLRGRFGYPADEPFRPTFHPERLDQVNSKQKPQVIALCFMSDPFHEGHLPWTTFKVLRKVLECSQHIFIALTKRYDEMKYVLHIYTDSENGGKPIPNLIGGVSIWDQSSADRMIPILLQTNLATRIVSLEPCLGAVDLRAYLPAIIKDGHLVTIKDSGFYGLNRLDGIILGGESGPGARPMHPDWARSVRDQCQAANVPFFLKQIGEYLDIDTAIKRKFLTTYEGTPKYQPYARIEGYELPFVKVGKKAAGRLLDGVEHNEMSEVMKP